MTENLLNEHKNKINSLELLPSGGGVFEVTVNGKLVFSKKALGRFPKEGEAEEVIRSEIA